MLQEFMDIFIGNLSHDVCEEDIFTLFAPFGQVTSVILNKLLTFGFVKMKDSEATAAIQQLQGSDFQGRKLILSRARGTGRYRPTTRKLRASS